MTIMAKFAFKKGWDQVPKGKAATVKAEIKAALKISGEATFYNRMKGTPEPTVSEYEAISKIFRKVGITDPWGE